MSDFEGHWQSDRSAIPATTGLTCNHGSQLFRERS